MFDKNTIKKGIETLKNAGYIDDSVQEDLIDFQIDKAIEYGATYRNCTIDELEKETKNYNSVLISMVHSALNLQDKLGLTSVSQNGVSNNYENGSIYQKEDIKQFVPRYRGLQ